MALRLSPGFWAAALAAILAALVATAAAPSAAQAQSACPAPEDMTFGQQGFVDMTRAGGEPTVTQHPDGTLLYGAHAGTTHFYSLAAADEGSTAFGQNYTGQTYIWWSQDLGKTWNFAPRTLPPGNAPSSGFSDPEWAIDTAGQVYSSEINLANVAISKSVDSGKSWTLQNFFGEILTDRQWKDADTKDNVYMNGNSFGGGTFPNQPVAGAGHFIYKSKDGGKTFPIYVDAAGGIGDIIVDKRNGTLYETRNNGTLAMRVWPNARNDDLTTFVDYPIAEGVSMIAHWPAFDIDDEGNLYVTWDERGSGDRPAGIYYSYSTDGAKTWAPAQRVSKTTNTQIWPWISVGDKGNVAVAWFEADVELPDHDAEASGDHGWRVVMAGTRNGLGCASGSQAGWAVNTATKDPVHRGTICQGGTACQAQAIDRRLGDFFTIDIDMTGRVWAGYSDTSQGGGTALPGFVRQEGGPLFRGGAAETPGGTPPSQTDLLPVEGKLSLDIASSGGRRDTARKRGIRVRIRCSVQCRATAKVVVSRSIAAKLGLGKKKTTVATGFAEIKKSGRIPFFVKLTPKASKALKKRVMKRVPLTVNMMVTDSRGKQTTKRSKKITLR
jgi:hypothetical protein